MTSSASAKRSLNHLRGRVKYTLGFKYEGRDSYERQGDGRRQKNSKAIE